jgi:hypothetical protein
MSTVEYIPLRQAGGSIYFRIPASYLHAHGLKAGDIVIWDPSAGRFKVVKLSQLEEIASQADASQNEELEIAS